MPTLLLAAAVLLVLLAAAATVLLDHDRAATGHTLAALPADDD